MLTEEQRLRIRELCEADGRRKKGHHQRIVILHLTEEQYQFLLSMREDYRKGLGWFVRRLLIIDMVKRNFRGDNENKKR